MKRLLLFTVAALTGCGTAHAQAAFAFPTKFNILYIGIENPVRIMVDGAQCKDYSLKMSGATVKPVGDCLFSIYVEPLTSPQWRDAYILDRNGSVVHSSKFRLQIIPDPVISETKSFVRPMPRSAGSLYSVLDTTQFEWHFTIVDFSVTRQRGKGTSASIINKTAKFGPELLTLIKTARSRDVFYFESIRVKGADGYLRYLNSIRLMCE